MLLATPIGFDLYTMTGTPGDLQQSPGEAGLRQGTVASLNAVHSSRSLPPHSPVSESRLTLGTPRRHMNGLALAG